MFLQFDVKITKIYSWWFWYDYHFMMWISRNNVSIASSIRSTLFFLGFRCPIKLSLNYSSGFNWLSNHLLATFYRKLSTFSYWRGRGFLLRFSRVNDAILVGMFYFWSGFGLDISLIINNNTNFNADYSI